MGYLIAVVGGIPFTYAWSEFLFWLLETKVPRTTEDPERGAAAEQRIWWIAVMIGIFERLIITTLMAYAASAVGAFLTGGMGIKFASGWQRWSRNTRYTRAAAFMALLGNAMSILFGLPEESEKFCTLDEISLVNKHLRALSTNAG
jgi:hypothetical protein